MVLFHLYQSWQPETARSIGEVPAGPAAAGIVAPERILDAGDVAPYEVSSANVGRLRGQLGWSPSMSLDRGIDAVAESAREWSGA